MADLKSTLIHDSAARWMYGSVKEKKKTPLPIHDSVDLYRVGAWRLQDVV